MKRKVFALIVTLTVLAGFFSPSGLVKPQPVYAAVITIDGSHEDNWGNPVATDPLADMTEPNLDLYRLYMAEDTNNYYIGFDAYASSWGMTYGIYIDTDQVGGSGASTDPWGRAVDAVNDHLPEYALYVFHEDTDALQDAQLATWDGSSWSYPTLASVGGEQGYGAANDWIEYRIPKTALGNPDQIAVEVFTTGGSGHAQDTVPSDPNVAYTSPDWGGDTTTLSSFYTFPPVIIDGAHEDTWGDPVATDPLADMTEPNLDLYRLYMAEDADNYYIGFDAYASSWGMTYGIYIDTDQVSGSGASTDPWGRAVDAVNDHLPEYALYVFHEDTDALQDAQLTTWDGSSWSYPTLASVGGEQGYGAANDWIEYRIPKTALGNPDQIAVEVFTTGGSGHAQDTVPSDPNVAYTSPDWGGDTTTLSSFYTFPQPPLQLQIDYPADGAFFATPDINVIGSVTPSTGVTVTVNLNSTNLYTPTLDASGNFTQPVTLVRGPNVITVEATDGVESDTVIRNVNFGAEHDNNIFWGGLGHNSLDPHYRTPLGAVTTGMTVTLRLRAYSNDLTGAKVRVWNDYNNVEMMLNMELVADDGTYEWWEAEVPASSIRTIYWYRFIAIDGTDVDYYEDDAVAQGGWGQAYDESEDRSWQITVYDPAFQTPDWVKNTVFYQIFPDRFRDGRPENNVITGTFFYGSGEADTIYRSGGGDWNTAVCDPRDDDGDCPNIWSQNFYGGDLQGVREKLDYLEDLGITSIYFNPIFESPSNHKYDTRNFMVIDDNLAAEGDFDASLAVFTDTVEQAATHGINVILDGVFNHTSSDSIYFDRYERYPEVGACESESSPYRGWYYFEDVAPGTGPCVGSDGTANAATYTSWFGYDSLPKLRADNAEVRDLIYDQGLSSVGPYWVQWADGWRLDVAGDVDPGHVNAPTNDFWEEFRDAVHTVNAETYIVGEEWGNSTPWLLGEEWDASMNYQMGTAIMGFWRDSDFVDNDHNAGSSAGIIRPLSPSQLDERLHYLESRYPPEAFYAMLNLLDSHDTNRALFMLDPNTHLNDPSLYEDPNYDWSTATQRLKGTVILQMTLPGAPTVYYGDELGLVGPVAHDGNVWQDDPYNRQPYPWLDEDGTPYYPHLQSGGVGRTEILPHYQLLIAARTAHEALRTGSFDTLLTDDDNSIYAYGRLLPDLSDAAVVIANGSDVTQTVTLDVEGYLPVGAHFVDVLDGNASHNVGGDGILTVADVPAMSGALLVLSDTVSAPPSAVNDLMVTVEGDGELTLEWSAATGADSYNIYRSLVSGGGYTFVATTTTTIFTDTMVQNSTTYYYVLESRDDTTHLTSEYSNEAWGMPHYSIGWANLSGPAEITHTIGITPTEPITGQVWINGVTSAPGETEGLIAQVGYGPAVEDPMEWTHWVDASYSHDLSGNDVFSGTLIPEETGEFEYVYRYSTTGGRDWTYADLDGTTPPLDNPGLLHVLPAADTTPPPVPQNLWVTYWNASSIALAWDAVTAADLYAYDLYREDAGGGPAMVARILAPTTVYTDDTVTTGETYTYTVRAVDENFNKSAPSNEASAMAEAREVEVRFIVEVPDFTPDDATIYIAGDNAEVFGAGWNASAQPIAQLDATTWMYTATVGDGTALMYKYTRGSWETVEHWGTLTGFTNRELTVDYGATGVMTVTDTVYNWKDPLVVTTDPSDGALTWSPTDPVSVTFNHTLDTSLINSSTFTLTEYATGQVITGTFSFDEAIVVAYSDPDFGSGPITGTVVLFDPAVSLTADSYKVTLDAPGYKGTDNEGITMRRDYVWYFGIANDLAIAKEITLQRDPPQPGDTLTYTVYITNTGYASATGVRITDTLPSGVVGIDLDEVITVTAGGVQTFTVPAVVDAGTWAQVITNTAHYSHSSGSGEASAIFTVADAPDLTTSAKVSSFADAQVTPGERITYTVTLTNSSATDASVVVTDTLGNYYTVDNAWDFTEVASGVLRWSEVVTANSEVVLYFVVQVADLAELSVGRTILHNSILIDEGASTPFPVSDPRPPFVEVYGAYLPAVFRNYP